MHNKRTSASPKQRREGMMSTLHFWWLNSKAHFMSGQTSPQVRGQPCLPVPSNMSRSSWSIHRILSSYLSPGWKPGSAGLGLPQTSGPGHLMKRCPSSIPMSSMLEMKPSSTCCCQGKGTFLRGTPTNSQVPWCERCRELRCMEGAQAKEHPTFAVS